MEFSFSKRVNNIKPSAIRELAKLIQDPEIISFAGGMPAPELFPIEEMRKISSSIINQKGRKALQYSSTEGVYDLRKNIADRIKKFNVNCLPDNILITSGSQQGLEFTGKLFIDEGDEIICESPSYIGALNAFRCYNPKFVEVPMDNKGMIMDELEKILKTHPKVKFIYTIPNYQNPTGVSMSDERKKRLIELSLKYNIPVIEDNPYIELKFDEKDNFPIKSYDKEDNVIYLGSFSKTFCPGLRVGWILASEEIIRKYTLIKQGVDLHVNTLAQMEILEFISNYDYDGHISKIRSVYKKRRDVMLKTIEDEFPKEVVFTRPEGGMFIWVELPKYMDATDIFKKALEKKVAFVPGEPFYSNGGTKNCFRLNYATMSENRIIEGIKRIGQVLREEI